MSAKPQPIELHWSELFKPIEGLKTDVRQEVVIEREIIPLIFVPGIMGSRLRVAGKKMAGEKAWDPDSILFMTSKYGLLRSIAAKRKALLVGKRFDPAYLEVMPYRKADRAEQKHYKHFKNYRGAAERGWAEVYWRSYGALLKTLQDHDWPEPARHCFEFPVHAFGYNWSASNHDSGKALKQYIDKVIKTYTDQGRLCGQVILLTHSMGGLVARSACTLHGAAPQVLGVLHGVQPATGAAAAYWRMKGGFDRPQGAPEGEGWAWLRNPVKFIVHKTTGPLVAMNLGLDGEEVTALLGNMPGGLELLPTPAYMDNGGEKSWLRFPDIDGEGVVALPRHDVYQEIYLEKKAFYRLIDEAWLAPGEKKKKRAHKKSPWGGYQRELATAKRFHNKLKDKTHPVTYQFYSEGLATSDRIEYSRHLHHWWTKAKRLLGILKADAPRQVITAALGAPVKAAIGLKAFSPLGFVVGGTGAALVKDSDYMVNRGGYRAYTDAQDRELDSDHDEALFVMTLQMPGNDPVAASGGKESGGDGTVPVPSASALNVLESAPIGKDDGESWLKRDHEGIYRSATAQQITVTAINNFCLKKIKQKTGKGA